MVIVRIFQDQIRIQLGFFYGHKRCFFIRLRIKIIINESSVIIINWIQINCIMYYKLTLNTSGTFSLRIWDMGFIKEAKSGWIRIWIINTNISMAKKLFDEYHAKNQLKRLLKILEKFSSRLLVEDIPQLNQK